MQIVPQRDQSGAQLVTQAHAEAIENDMTYTLLHRNQVIACAGLIEQWHHRAFAWAVLSDEASRHFLLIHRAVKDFLDKSNYRRIEMAVDCDFMQAHRWARMLGFELEAPVMRHYGPDGRHCSLYARVT